MKTGLIVTGVLGAFLVLGTISSYNTMVPLSENVNVSYAQYQNQLKRQADLIPNLAEVVKGYMNSEQRTMIETAVARAGDASRMKPADVADNPELQKKLIDAQAGMGRAMVTLNAVREAYPNLKANEQVNNLMVELAGTQNRITVARGNNQKAVNQYNVAIQVFPRVMLARLFGFNVKPYYEASAEEQNVPKITFTK